MEWYDADVFSNKYNSIFSYNPSSTYSGVALAWRYLKLRSYQGEEVEHLEDLYVKFYVEQNNDIKSGLYFLPEDNEATFYKEKDYKRNNVIEEWIMQSTELKNIQVYINEKQEISVVIGRLSKYYCVIASCLWKLMPWSYNKDVYNPADEKQVWNGFLNSEKNKTIRYIDEQCSKIDLSKIYLAKLTKFNTNSYDRKIRALSSEIRNYYDVIKSYEGEIAKNYRRIEENNDRIFMLRNKDAKESIGEIFKTHENLKLREVTESLICFEVRDFLEYYDEDVYKINISNYLKGYEDKDKEKLKLILDNIFVERKAKIFIKESFDFDGEFEIRPLQEGWIPEVCYENDWLYNPHLYYYSCFGNNGQYISKYLHDGEEDLAFEQVIASTKNINFSDNVVIPRFISDFFSSWNTRILMNNITNKRQSPSEFYDWLVKEKNNGESSTQPAEENSSSDSE